MLEENKFDSLSESLQETIERYCVRSGTSLDTLTPLINFLITNEYKDASDLSTYQHNSHTALMRAVKNNNAVVVKQLLDLGVDPNARSEFNRNTALILAADDNKKDLVKLLLAYGAETALINSEQKTAHAFAYDKCVYERSEETQVYLKSLELFDYERIIHEVYGDTLVIEEKLGEGGNASVFAVRDIASGDRYALKVITHAKVIEREFEFEAAVLKNLGLLHGQAQAQDRIGSCLLMKLEQGYSLDEYLENNEDLSFAQRLDIIVECIKSVKELHDKNVIHNDIAAKNFIYDEETHEMRVVDFGWSRIVPEDTNFHDGVCVEYWGWRFYTAPEHKAYASLNTSPRQLTPKVDSYALGRTVLNILSDSKSSSLDDGLVMLGAINKAFLLSLIADEPAERPDIGEVLSRFELIKFLDDEKFNLKKMRDINSVNYRHYNPLMLAVKRNRVDLVETLLAMGANPDKENRKTTARNLAREDYVDEAIKSLLITTLESRPTIESPAETSESSGHSALRVRLFSSAESSSLESTSDSNRVSDGEVVSESASRAHI